MNIRKYLLPFLLLLLTLAGCYKNEPVPAADFSWSGSNQFYIPCTVQFSNASVNAYNWEWHFGDDSVSEAKEPSHFYSRPGSYSVTLRAYTQSRKEWASVIKTVVIRDTIH